MQTLAWVENKHSWDRKTKMQEFVINTVCSFINTYLNIQKLTMNTQHNWSCYTEIVEPPLNSMNFTIDM